MKKRIILSCLACLGAFFWAMPGYGESKDPARLFSKNADAIVLIAASCGNNETKLGSGFIVTEDGLILTNYHIIENAEKIVVKLKNNRAYSNVQVAGQDPKRDIALLKIRAQDLKKVRLGDSDDVDIGQRVVSIGNPLGLESTISDGLISSKRKTDDGLRLLQISVPLSEGSSGGPLFNLKGKVIGITTASFLQGQNLNFALPINYAKSLIRKAKNRDYRPRARDRDLKITKKEASIYREAKNLPHMPPPNGACGQRHLVRLIQKI